MTDLEWAYLAGLFDGEGCVSVAYRQAKPAAFPLMLAICNTHPAFARWCKERFGGHVHRYQRSREGRRRQDYWEWKISGNAKVPKVLWGMFPYLVIKREQAITAVTLARLCRTQWAGRTSRALPALAIEARQVLRHQLSRLKGVSRRKPLLA